MLRVWQGVVGLMLLAQASMASAVLSIEIIGAGENQIPVAIVPFGGDDKLAQSINEVVVGDLQRSGLFRIVDPVGKNPHEVAEVSYPDWQVRGADALAIGTVTAQASGRVEARFRLLDVVKQNELPRGGFSERWAGTRHRSSHRRSDLREADWQQRRIQYPYRLCEPPGAKFPPGGRG